MEEAISKKLLSTHLLIEGSCFFFYNRHGYKEHQRQLGEGAWLVCDLLDLWWVVLVTYS